MNNEEFKDLEELIEYPPKKLYKYTSADTCCKILESMAIRMTAPADFNDPYDSKPIFRCPDKYIEYNRKSVLDMLKQERKLGLLDKNKQKAFILLLRDFPDVTCDISYKDEIERTRDSVCEDFRVLCLTQEKDNILMWSHYAQNHSGTVIEFDTEANLFNSCRKVIYSNEAPFINGDFTLKQDISKINTNDYQEILKILYTKSDIWKYEKEWRYYFNFMTNTNLPKLLKGYVDDTALKNFETEISNTAKNLHLPLFINHITAIYLGCNIDKQNENKIITLCKQNYPKAKIYKAVLDKNYFKINFIEYNDFYKDNRDPLQKLATIISNMYIQS